MKRLVLLALATLPLAPAFTHAQVVQNFAFQNQNQVGRCTSVRFQWSGVSPAPAAGVGGFRLYRDGVRVNSEEASWDSTWLDRGQVYRYTARVVDGAGTEFGDSAPLLFTPPACPPLPSTLKVRLLKVEFPDKPALPNPALIYSDFFTTTDSVASYYTRVSKGAFGLSGVLADAQRPVFRLPYAYSHYCGDACNYIRIMNDVRALADPEIDFTGVDRIAITINDAGPGVGGVSPGYMGTDEGIIQVIMTKGGNAAQTGVHEIGHTLNFMGHSGGVFCPDGTFPPDLTDPTSGGCQLRDYGDGYDPMGTVDESYSTDFHLINQERLGFYVADQFLEVTPRATAVDYTLWAVEKEGGIKGLRIPVGNASYYYVEYHKSPQTNAVFVRWKPGVTTRSGSYLPAKGKLNADLDKIDDPHRSFRVRLMSKNGTTAKVRIKTLPE